MNKPREFWISGINFDEYILYDKEVLTGFITIKNPNKKEAIHVREVIDDPIGDILEHALAQAQKSKLDRTQRALDLAKAILREQNMPYIVEKIEAIESGDK